MGKINPKQIASMMKQMGIKSEEIEAKRVIFELKDKRLIIENPKITAMEMQEQKTYTVMGDATEEPMGIPDEEIKMISQVNYLFGMIMRKGGEEKFIPLVANNLDEEEKIFKEFLDLVLKEEDFVIYYYSIFEKTNLNRMFEQYGTNEETKRKIMENAIDLQKEIKNSITFPTTKNGLKEIAQYLGFQWRHKDVNAQESMAWYFEFMEKGDKEKLQKIIDYNEDDCRATLIIKDWLVNKFRD